MAILMRPLLLNPSSSFFPSCPKDHIPYLVTNASTSHQVSISKCLHFSAAPNYEVATPGDQQSSSSFEPNKLEGELKLSEEMHQREYVLTKDLDFDGYLEESRLGMEETSQSIGINDVHHAFHGNRSADTYSIFANGIKHDRVSLVGAFGLCARLGSLDLGRTCHTLVIKIGVECDKFIASSLIDMYSKCKHIYNAHKVFHQLPYLDIVSCNSLLSGYANNELFNEALNLFVQVQSMDIKPSHYTFSIMLSVCGNLLAIEEGRQLHAQIIKMQLLSETIVDNALLTMYSRCKMMTEVEVLFEKIPNRNFISWTAIITGFYQNGFFEKALRHFYYMRHGEVEPNEYTFATALASCGSMNSPDDGRRIHALVIKAGVASSVYVATAIVDMYLRHKHMHDAEKQFLEMGTVTSVVSWNALMMGYIRNSQSDKAMEVFIRMLGKCVTCNQFTYSIILKACSSLASLASGLQVHSLVLKTKHRLNAYIGGSLIEMYSNCGSLQDANQVFSRMPSRDTISWNSMIKAYSQNGITRKAISLFKQMLEEGTRPSSATFLALLAACSHSGLVQEGEEMYETMVQDFGIIPEEKHHSCIVDLLGRAGQLKEALDFINTLPFKPTSSVWRPLLAACGYHADLQMAELVAECILEMEPYDSTVYITLSNMYAKVGRWGDVEKQRQLMEIRGVRKEPGCSWIEVSQKVYRFFSRDRTHRQTREIYNKLKELVRQIKYLGYVPDKNLVLDQRQGHSQEEHVIHHSEKLAVSFGLISLPAGKPIRIFKNLRICNDCHTAMKYISDITERDIIIKDNYRFHHFKRGCCSCNDYW